MTFIVSTLLVRPKGGRRYEMKKHSLDCHIVACMADTPWWCMWMDRWK